MKEKKSSLVLILTAVIVLAAVITAFLCRRQIGAFFASLKAGKKPAPRFTAEERASFADI